MKFLFFVRYILLFSAVTTMDVGAVSRMGQWALFLKTALKEHQQTGAIAPFSPFVAQEITKYIQKLARTRSAGQGPLTILEVGAGTGSMTEAILRSAQDAGIEVHTDIIEINPEFCQLLTARFGDNPHAKVHCQDVCAFTPLRQYDIIISTLPFTNMDTDVVDAILTKYRSLIKPSGVISYVEYIGLAQIKLLFMKPNDKRILYKKKLALLQDFRKHFTVNKVIVLGNLPPTYVYHLTPLHAV